MLRFILSLLLLLPSVSLADSVVQLDNTRASLIASHAELKPGGAFSLGVLLEPREGWHTYWENPGDAGIPITLEWTLPEGLSAGPVQWPMPTRLMEDTLAVYAYESAVLLPVIVQLPEHFTGTSVPVKVSASWLICEKICIPESAELEIELPVGEYAVQSGDLEKFARAWSALPDKLSAPLSFSVSGEHIELELSDPIAAGSEAYFYPREQNVIAYAAAQTLSGRTLRIPRAAGGDMPQSLSGYLTVDSKSYAINLQQSGAPAPERAAPPASAGFLTLLLSALLGGLILNLMPCVLPVLSLKALAIAKKSGHERRVAVKQSLAYTGGIILSFMAIATLLISLQMAGESVGWGFQMQSPPFVGFLALLLFAVGLNLIGMFDLPVLFGNALSDNRQHGMRGSFLTGVLATAVATPCTAPFMATAVGATLTLPPALSLLIFVALGLGMALPFLLIAFFPRLIAYLPKPGAWMETFKQLMAFPMFASVIWLVWVLVQQTGADGLLVILITMLGLSFLIWLKGRCRDTTPFCRVAVLLLLLAVIVDGLSALSMKPSAEQKTPFSEATLAELRLAKTPVFVDATAAWCITCQVNARTAIDTEKSRAAFDETGTKLLIADWTNRSPEITRFLKRFGHNGVPLYVYYPASGEPVVLPQILTESLVISTLKGERP